MQTETKSPAVAPEAEMEGPVEARKEYRCVRTSLSKKKEAYSSYIAHVLKQTQPEPRGWGRAEGNLESRDGQLLERVAGEAVRLTHSKRRRTVTSREVRGALELVLAELVEE
ncbi:histone H2B type 1-N-like isoform X2 [Ornithorhynchus anatinus]|uniref:histone H2B type 1-N-like isoform X2 n=1 Tax=Ornithorhynchus anatinus TaxID=9258 RepID=UPI0010A78572|nr:histone H2B type 1-N-like isoform X2 [Ornithorhynchus anatinus]